MFQRAAPTKTVAPSTHAAMYRLARCGCLSTFSDTTPKATMAAKATTSSKPAFIRPFRLRSIAGEGAYPLPAWSLLVTSAIGLLHDGG